MPYTKGAANTSNSPYNGAGSTASNQQANNWECQYDEATLSFNRDFTTPYIRGGFTAAKNGTTQTQLDVAAGVGYPKQADSTTRRWSVSSSSQSTVGHPSTTMYLFLNPDGTFAWQTSSTPPTNALAICHVTTDASSNILTVTDDRVVSPNLFSAAEGAPNLPTGTTAGNSLIWTATNDGSGSGLDADTLDGHDSAYFLPSASYTAADVLSKVKSLDGSGSGLDADTLDTHDSSFFLAASSYTASDVLAKIKTVDGSGSGLDADTLDGHDSTYFATAGNYVSLSPAGSAEQIINGPIAIAQNNRLWVNVIGSVQAFDGGTHGHIGFVDNNSNKIAQFGAIPGHGAGDMAIAGSTYWTTTASAGFNNSATFSGFDVAEQYATDQEYANGTVVCPQDGAGGVLMRRCVHDGCHAALIVSKVPGFAIGGGAFTPDDDEEQPDASATEDNEPRELCAIAGRVRAVAIGRIPCRALVVANGAGGVRAMRPGETGFTIGVALDTDDGGTVGVLVRPLYCQAPAMV